MNKSHIQLLRQNYEKACNAYLQAFCQKHGFHSSYWITDRIGEIADCNEFYSVDMADIRTDIDENAPEEEFLKWYNYCLDVCEFNLTQPNFHHWLKGCPRVSEEELKALRKKKQDFIAACQQAKDNL